MAVVVITGASSGIGRAMAIAWAARGASLILSGRNEVALARVAREVVSAGGEVFVEAGDVTNQAHRQRLIARALSEKGRIDVLVNNAGRGYYAALRDVDIAELEALFALNVVAPLALSQLALDPLVKSGGTIVMVSSVAGVAVAPRMGAYAASKFALEAISMALRAELRASGVQVVVIRPGPVETAFRDNSISTNSPAGVRPPGAHAQSAEQIAEKTVRAVSSGRAVVETSMFVRVASLTARAFPGPFRQIAARMARSSS